MAVFLKVLCYVHINYSGVPVFNISNLVVPASYYTKYENFNSVAITVRVRYLQPGD